MNAHVHFLQSFLTVAENSSITAAARELNITQSALSRQIQVLEDGLGTALFIRETTGVRLTESGRQLQERIVPLLRSLDEAVLDLRQNQKGIEGKIIVGALMEVGQSQLFPRLLTFQKNNPAIDLEVQYLKEMEIIAGLREGALDWGLIMSPLLSEELRVFAWQEERCVVVTRAENKTNLEDRDHLLQSRFVTYRKADPLLGAFLRQHFPNTSHARLPVPLAVNSHRSMMDALFHDDLMAIMPWHVVKEAVKKKHLRQASSKELSGKVYLVVTEAALTMERHKALKSHLLDARKNG